MKLTPITIFIYALAFVGARKLWLDYRNSRVTTKGGVAKEEGAQPKNDTVSGVDAGKLAKKIWQNIKTMDTAQLTTEKTDELRHQNAHLLGKLEKAGYNYDEGMAVPKTTA